MSLKWCTPKNPKLIGGLPIIVTLTWEAPLVDDKSLLAIYDLPRKPKAHDSVVNDAAANANANADAAPPETAAAERLPPIVAEIHIGTWAQWRVGPVDQ